MFTHWNVHRCNAERVEQLLNDHADKGYDMRYVRGVGGANSQNLQVFFTQQFSSEEARDAFRAERAKRRASRPQAPTSATPAQDAPTSEPALA